MLILFHFTNILVVLVLMFRYFASCNLQIYIFLSIKKAAYFKQLIPSYRKAFYFNNSLQSKSPLSIARTSISAVAMFVA